MIALARERPKSFPLGGSWHREAVTDEGTHVKVSKTIRNTKLRPLIRPFGAPSPQGEGYALNDNLPKQSLFAQGKAPSVLKTDEAMYYDQNMVSSWKIRLAETPAQRPPMVWQRMALPVRWLDFRASIMATWVDR